MATQKNHDYTINLDISTPAASKEALKQLKKSLEDCNNPVDELNKTYLEMSKNTQDNIELEKQYNKVISEQLAIRDKQIDKLEAEKIAISQNKELTEEQRISQIKEKDAQIKKIKLEKDLINIKSKDTKILAKNIKQQKELEKLSDSTVKKASKLCKLQEKLVQLLGKESKLRKTMSNIKSAATKAAPTVKKAAGTAAKVGGGALAISGMIMGVVAGGVETQANKAQALRLLKPGIDPKIVDAIYTQVGGDYTEIIAAINRATDVVGKTDTTKLVAGGILEMQNPGMSTVISSDKNMANIDLSRLTNMMNQIKSQYGLDDLTQFFEATTKDSNVTSGKISRVEHIQAQAALQSAGFQPEDIEKIIKETAKKEGNFINNLNNTDLTKFTNDAQFKQRLGNVPLNIIKLDENKTINQTDAEIAAQKLRELQVKKDEVIVKLAPSLTKVLDAIVSMFEDPEIQKLLDSLGSLLPTLIEGIMKIITVIAPVITELVDGLIFIINKVKDKYAQTAKENIEKNKKDDAYREEMKQKSINEFKNRNNENLKKLSGDERNELWRLQMNQKNIDTFNKTHSNEKIPDIKIPEKYLEFFPKKTAEAKVPTDDITPKANTTNITNNNNTSVTQTFNMTKDQQSPLAFAYTVATNPIGVRNAYAQ
jgi:hypothetical protein